MTLDDLSGETLAAVEIGLSLRRLIAQVEAAANGKGLNAELTMTFQHGPAGYWDSATVSLWDAETGATVAEGWVGGGGSADGALGAALDSLQATIAGQ